MAGEIICIVPSPTEDAPSIFIALRVAIVKLHAGSLWHSLTT